MSDTCSLTNRGTSSNLTVMDKTLTMADLHGPFLNGRHLVFDRGQLLLEGLLGPPGVCNDSRSQTQHQEHAKHTKLARGDLGNLPSIMTWRSGTKLRSTLVRV
jgi:hypothetical protein